MSPQFPKLKSNQLVEIRFCSVPRDSAAFDKVCGILYKISIFQLVLSASEIASHWTTFAS